MLSEKQQNILDVTKKIFKKKGYYGTTMNAIAEAVGIRKATLYTHFNHKDALFHYLFEEILSVHKLALEEIFDALEGKSVKRQLYEFLKSYVFFCYHNETIELWNHLYYYPPETMAEWIRNATHRAEKRIKDYMMVQIKDGQHQKTLRPGNPEIIFQLYYNLYIGFVLSAPEYEDLAIDDILHQSFLLFWDSIRYRA